MGVSGLWNDFETATESITTLSHFADRFHAKHDRQPRVAVDMSIFLYELSESTKSWGHVNFHRQFIRRLAALQAAGILVIGVFDGPKMHHKLRHKQHRKRAVGTNVLLFMRECLAAMGIPVIDAPSEAEAQCCELQRLGLADAIFSSDSDVFCLGVKTVMRYAPEQTTSSESSALMRPIQVVELAGSEEERWSYILRAILLGNDFDSGVANLGASFAKQIASVETRFSSELSRCYRSKQGRAAWLNRLENELKQNESGYFRQLKHNAGFPPNFPDPEIIDIFACPKVSKFCERHVLQSGYNVVRLQQLWLGASPLKCKIPPQTGPKKLIRKVTNEQEFINTIAGAVLVAAIMAKRDQKQWYRRVFVPSEPNYTVNVTLGETSLSLSEPPSRSTRIAHFVAKQSTHDILNKHSLAHRDNSRIGSYFQPISTLPPPGPVVVVPDQSAYVDLTEEDGDTDVDEPVHVDPTPKPTAAAAMPVQRAAPALKRNQAKTQNPEHTRSCSLLAQCMPSRPPQARKSLTLPTAPIAVKLQPILPERAPKESPFSSFFKPRSSTHIPLKATKSQSFTPRPVQSKPPIPSRARKAQSVSGGMPTVSPLQPTILEFLNRSSCPPAAPECAQPDVILFS